MLEPRWGPFMWYDAFITAYEHIPNHTFNQSEHVQGTCKIPACLSYVYKNEFEHILGINENN